MYKNVTVVEKEKHTKTRFERSSSVKFASKISHVGIAAGEFASACKSQPILFIKADSEYAPFAVMGLKQNQNLFVDEKNRWLPLEYSPFFFLRYPFIYVRTGDKFSLAFDSAYHGISEDKGDALFDEEGELTEFARKTVKRMDAYQADLAATAEFSRRVDELELFEPFELSFSADKNNYNFKGFYKISYERFNKLSGDIKLELLSKRYYDLILAHIISLGNFEKLAKLQTALARKP